jgi:hypothetical protein
MHGRRTRCLECEASDQAERRKKNPVPTKRANAAWASRPERVRRDYLYRKRYGITIEQYEEMYQRQSGLCAICEKPQERLHVDHCDEPLVVRGLLCGSCNRGIGLLRHSESRLQAAISYLQTPPYAGAE